MKPLITERFQGDITSPLPQNDFILTNKIKIYKIPTKSKFKGNENIEGAKPGLFRNSLINGSHFTKSLIQNGTVDYSIMKSQIFENIDHSYIITPDETEMSYPRSLTHRYPIN